MTETILTEHASADTAYLIDDYPYGFRLRCQMRVWVESNKHGERVWRQTSNPKRPGTWNKPKASTYSPVVLLRLNADGHVESFGPNYYESDALQAFEAAYFEHLTSSQRNSIAYLIAGRRAMKRVTYSVHSHEYGADCDQCRDKKPYAERQRDENKLITALVRDELRKESNAALTGEPFDR